MGWPGRGGLVGVGWDGVAWVVVGEEGDEGMWREGMGTYQNSSKLMVPDLSVSNILCGAWLASI